jgi:hypothetical protein
VATPFKVHQHQLQRSTRAWQRPSKLIIKGSHAHHGHGSLQSAVALKRIDGTAQPPALRTKNGANKLMRANISKIFRGQNLNKNKVLREMEGVSLKSL